MSEIHHALSGPAGAPVVLLLHGLGACGDDWPRQVPALVERYRVLSVDLPGHRHSPPLRGLPSIGRMAGAVDRLLDALAIERTHVIGLSLGGCVALALALRAPARVQSLVVVNSFARLRPIGLRATARGARRLVLALVAPMRIMAAHVARETFPGADQQELRHAVTARLAATSRRGYLTTLAALLSFDVRRRLGDIRCPTLIVAGDRDATVPLEAKRLLARSIPGATLHLVADSGHVTPFDRSETFNALLLEHLARVDVRFSI